MEEYIHKINGVIGKTSLNVVLPKNFINDLNIQKGDFVEINKDDDKIVIKKLRV